MTKSTNSKSGDSGKILVAKNLSRNYTVSRGVFHPLATVRALTDVSFDLAAGETLAVVGESGSGKSTLARLVTMIEAPSAGSLVINGIDVAQATAAQRLELRRQVQIVFQDPFGSLNPRQTIGAALAEPLLVNTKLGRVERESQVRTMIERVGLRPELLDRYPHMFSGGQRQRIAIARALMLRPRLLVLDEPVSALDLSIRAQVLNLLVELQDEFKLAYLFISHDLSVVKHIADQVLVIYLGRAAELGDSAQLFAKPLHPYSRALLSATPVADPLAKKDRIILSGDLPSPFAPPSGCRFHPRCAAAKPHCSEQIPVLEAKQGRTVACFEVKG
ncbi:MAG: dipeptide ABC transporter ATP-binding protein [Candidatus Pacebacteria bacterium]|nr:dipeptide ABC transporter ATP-binding protein [Candidatus Paceibacterota bacterium]